MLGAIAGDVIGSVFEWRAIKTKAFDLFAPESRFTDDTVLTLATAEALMTGADFAQTYQTFGRRHPDAGYGGRFQAWLLDDAALPYNSFGNGSAMRAAPLGWAFNQEDAVLKWAQKSASATHDHPEGIKGAQATALAILLARQGAAKSLIRSRLAELFGYDLDRGLDEIRPSYRFDVTCQGSVPEALIAFFEAEDFTDAIRNAVSLGGDADTQACIAGGVAEAFFGGVPEDIRREVERRLDLDLADVLHRFRAWSSAYRY